MMRSGEPSQLQGILRLKFSYVCRSKGEDLTIQELGMNANKIQERVAVLGRSKK